RWVPVRPQSSRMVSARVFRGSTWTSWVVPLTFSRTGTRSLTGEPRSTAHSLVAHTSSGTTPGRLEQGALGHDLHQVPSVVARGGDVLARLGGRRAGRRRREDGVLVERRADQHLPGGRGPLGAIAGAAAPDPGLHHPARAVDLDDRRRHHD